MVDLQFFEVNLTHRLFRLSRLWALNSINPTNQNFQPIRPSEPDPRGHHQSITSPIQTTPLSPVLFRPKNQPLIPSQQILLANSNPLHALQYIPIEYRLHLIAVAKTTIR